MSVERRVCELNERNGEIFYRVLVDWRVPWSRAPLEHFVPAWLNVPADRRRQLLQEAPQLYVNELHQEDGHMLRLCLHRDDARLFAVPSFQEKVVTKRIRVIGAQKSIRDLGRLLRNILIQQNAIHCLDVWASTRPVWTTRPGGILYSKDRSSGQTALEVAAYWEKLKMLRHLREKYQVEWTEKVCTEAASNNSVECLEYAIENNCPWEPYLICLTAAKNGHVDCLQVAHEQFGEDWWTEDEKVDIIVESAAKGGHLECLKYLHRTGAPLRTTMACAFAAEADSLECLAFLHEHGCPWDKLTCFCAAEMGSLDCIIYARDNGCPWNESEVRGVATPEILAWMHWDGFTDMRTAAAASPPLPAAVPAVMAPDTRGVNFVELDYDVDVPETLRTNADALAFRQHGVWSMTTRTELAKAMGEPSSIRFECRAVDEMALQPRASNIVNAPVYFTLQSIGIGNGLVLVPELNYVLAHPEVRALAISDAPVRVLPAAASQYAVEHFNPDVVGADHCQRGSDKNVHSLAVVALDAAADSLPPPPPPQTPQRRSKRLRQA